MKRWAILSLLFVGCQSTPQETKKDESWELAGWRTIGCCCASPCPCRINRKPQFCHGCDFSVGVHIDRGQIGGVRMDGADWVVTGRGFGEDPKKNWVYVYTSEKMTDEQVKALQGFLEAGLKAAGAKAPHLFGTFVGMRKAPMTLARSSDKREVTITIPGIFSFQNRTIILPGHTEPVTSTGIFDDFGNSFTHCETLEHKYEDSSIQYHFDLKGRQSNVADFHIGSNLKTPYKLGWGCWSAHQEFNSDSEYVEKIRDHAGHK